MSNEVVVQSHSEKIAHLVTNFLDEVSEIALKETPGEFLSTVSSAVMTVWMVHFSRLASAKLPESVMSDVREVMISKLITFRPSCEGGLNE